jgi:8-oxo-dGTP diphosphatase
MVKIIRAVAGVLQFNSHVLIASRPAGKTHAFNWEFPGGKLEEGETAVDALIRELKEEIDINVSFTDCIPITFLTQSYAHGDVQLDVLKVIKWQGEPRALEGQEIYWQDITKPCTKHPLLITTQLILDILATNFIDK